MKLELEFEDLTAGGSYATTNEGAVLISQMIDIRTANRRKIIKKMGKVEFNLADLFDIAQKKDKFDKEEHRLEHLAYFNGANFVNDSQACNVNATYFSLEKMKGDVVWIAGGDDATVNYRELLISVSQKVKMLICIGNDNRKLVGTFIDYIPAICERKNMEDAVRTASRSSEKGNIILLSPGCDCDELYVDYQSRGNAFKKAILQL